MKCSILKRIYYKIAALRYKKVAQQKLSASLRRVLNEKEATYRAEMAEEPPFIFSAEFEAGMKKMMVVRKRKTKIYNTVRYAAATFVTVLLIGGILFVGNEEARASKLGINILSWMENFFLVDEGETSRKEEEVLFEESQIGYLPDGFELVVEEEIFSKVHYKYQNAVGDYIVIDVYRDKALSGIDNEDIGQDINLNAAGLEYRFIDKEEKAVAIAWTDKQDVYYCLISTLKKEEIINIMDGISYR